MHRRNSVVVALAVIALGITTSGRLGGAQEPDPAARFERREAMVPMRDGVKLHTVIFAPKDQSGPLPIILERTPYGVANAGATLGTSRKELAADGYIFAFQDIRGRYRSEGRFVMLRPTRDRLSSPKPPGEGVRDATAVDEGTDAYDTIDWVMKNVANHNGRVGMMGVSYPGWLVVMALLEPHPALKAVSPQASPADMWIGDDFHHNGAFRLSYGFEYATRMETTKEQTPFEFDRYDTFDWYLTLGPLANVNAKYLRERIPTWNDFVEHPDYDEFWKRQTMIPQLTSATVPTLNVAGWWDQEDFYGPVKIYETLETLDTARRNFLVVGPWNHGGWSRGDGNRLGNIDFGKPTARDYRERIQAPFFAYYLKDKGALEQPEAVTFETGASEWRSWDAWPPVSRTDARNVYFHADERLAFKAPPDTGPAFDSYTSDPAHPVPYRARPIPPTYFPGGSGWTTWLVEDQRFVDDRPDVASWETDPLPTDLTIAGRIVAHLFASTTGTDSDWVVKLIDVYPEQNPKDWKMAGYQLMVSNEVFRGRYRKSFEKPEAVPAGQVVSYTIDLHTQNYRFLKDHRVMVQVQSTWFPLIDRNPQTFVPNIFKADAAAYRRATQRVYRSKQYPSHLTIPVVKAGS